MRETVAKQELAEGRLASKDRMRFSPRNRGEVGPFIIKQSKGKSTSGRGTIVPL
jgi:hypothetical protein